MSRPVYKKDFPARFKKAREDSELTLKQLEAKTGVSFQTIQRWETGERKPERVAAERAAYELQSDFGEPWLARFASEPLRDIPVVAYVAGGKPIVEEIRDQFVKIDPEVTRLSPELCGLKVRGDSMVEQHILSGDILICRRVADPKSLPKGTIVVVDLKGERGASVKRWEYKNGTIYLYAEKNAKEGDKQEFHDWEVGKVFWIIGLMRGSVK